jgi:hypothetical protein
MWGSAAPELPAGTHTVLVVGSAGDGAGACAALAEGADRVLLVDYGDLTADGLRERLAAQSAEPPPVRALGVGEDVEPGDLTAQGIGVAESLSSDTAVCVDGLGTIVERVDRDPVFRFVHSLAERCARSSSAMHYHLDPATVEGRTVAALSTLMDAVVRVEDDAVAIRPALTDTD